MSESRIVRPLAAGAPKVERDFMDAAGAHWHVYEQPFSDYDRRQGTSLIFASDAAVRRVRSFPANWYTLTEDELLELSWMA